MQTRECSLMITSALIIREPWIGLILDGKKTWEMRSQATTKRGVIGLIRQGSGLIVGTARIVDSLPALTRATYMDHAHRHAIPGTMLDEVIAQGWVHPWVLAEVKRLPEPVPYAHKSGAVTFVTLEPETSDAILSQLGAAAPVSELPGRERAAVLQPPPAPPVRPAPGDDPGTARSIVGPPGHPGCVPRPTRPG